MAVILVKMLVVLFLASVIPGTAYSFIRFRLKKKAEEYSHLIDLLKIVSHDQSKIPRIKKEYAPTDYMLPVAFASLVSFAACIFLLFGGELTAISIQKNVDSVLLSGIGFSHSIEDEATYRRSLAVIITAMMGGYVMAAQNVIRRLLTMDLTPGAYYSAGLRIIFAALVALILSFIIGDTVSDGMLSGIAFLTGIFPERGLRVLMEKVKILSEKTGLKSDDLPLEMIEGISYFHKIRLTELGIDNAQNLAEANFLDLVVKTSFPPNQLLDWISQAELYMRFKDNIKKLREVGIRNVFDYLEVGRHPKQLKEVAELTGIPELTLTIAFENTNTDQQIHMLHGFQKRLNTLEVEG